MPWKESSVMEGRLRFVARLLDGEPMTDLCREFGISRKTGRCTTCSPMVSISPVTTIGETHARQAR
jgi:hypothetical protein